MLRKVTTLDALWSGETLGVTVDGRRVLLVNVDGDVCAFEDRCPHKGVPLSQGRLEEGTLVCAVHGWSYDARTGRDINPRGVDLKRIEVRVEGDDVFLDLKGEP